MEAPYQLGGVSSRLYSVEGSYRSREQEAKHGYLYLQVTEYLPASSGNSGITRSEGLTLQ